MKVQLLFSCTEKRENAWPGQTEKQGGVKLAPIGPYAIAGDDAMKAEVESFYKATPSGSFDFATVNEGALAAFEPGALYRITIERYTKPAAAEAEG